MLCFELRIDGLSYTWDDSLMVYFKRHIKLYFLLTFFFLEDGKEQREVTLGVRVREEKEHIKWYI